ncbi:hypothetical protein QCA50_011538 [Cerrena zonata]|uniref:Ap4A phosphorylase 1/2 N-terminal domain-containing protein n=1 Tax=Cerrena zonata TaxID=2478898 RepID=A0AAW0G225_9APHY
MITFVSSETFRITRQSITRDLFSLSRLGSIHSRNRTRSLRLSASGYFNPTKGFFSHPRKAHSTSLPSSRTPSTRPVVSICLRPYATHSNSNLGMAISKSAPTDIIKGLSAKYDKAIESGDLLFFPSTNTTYEENGVEFEIRLCPALQKKPSEPTPHFDAEEDAKKVEKDSKRDPFAPPYNENLYIGEVIDEEEHAEYVVLFNKYSVVAHHVLLVTKEFHSQTAPLLPSDLVQTYKLLLAARDNGKKFFAFYNCGNLSGASQPHKHLQLIPIESDGPPIERVARRANVEVPERPFALSSLPYANHVRRLPTYFSSSTSTSELSHHLSQAFMSLLDLTISTIRHDTTYPVGPSFLQRYPHSRTPTSHTSERGALYVK